MISQLLIDGHVHVHECFDEVECLSAAHANLSRQGSGFPALLLAEMQGTRVFARWRDEGAGVSWGVTRTLESSSIVLGERLLVIAGRQIVTAERIEVLALLTAECFKDGMPLPNTLNLIEERGGMAVLPWGVGKWWGTRGRMVNQAVSSGAVLIADIAGRPMGWPMPRLFRRRVVLAGTDPLALPREETLVGTYGFALSGAFDLSRPAGQIALAVKELARSPLHFGQRLGPLRFIRRQLALRVRKRRTGGIPWGTTT
jgi:hypothetical protein